MKGRHAFLALTALLAAGVAIPAHATCALCSCTVTAAPMSFGAFAPTNNSNLDAVANIDVACTGTTALASIEIRLNQGQNGTFASRKLRSGADLLGYNIYSNAARSQIWGDGSGAYASVTVSNGLGLLTWNSSTPAYGRINAAPTASPGAYSDAIVVTVVW